MLYNLKYFIDNATVIEETNRNAIYKLDEHKICWDRCHSSISVRDHFSVYVDGETIATRCNKSECIKKALTYLNKKEQEQKQEQEQEQEPEQKQEQEQEQEPEQKQEQKQEHEQKTETKKKRIKTMKIFNTLTTSNAIRDFLNDGGRVIVEYVNINKVSDLYDTTKIINISCNFKGITTEMNKFYRFSLFSITTPCHIISYTNTIRIEFVLLSNNEEWSKMALELDIMKELEETSQKNIEHYEHNTRELENAKSDKYLYDILKGVKKITKKLANTIRTDIDAIQSLSKRSIILDGKSDTDIDMLKRVFNELLYMDDEWSFDEQIKYYSSEIEFYENMI